MSEEEVKAKAIEELNKKVSSITESQITGIAKKITDNFMSDRQVLKKIVSMKSPNLSDDELNLLVYGRDLKRELGASYRAWKSERDAEDEEDDDDDLKTKKDKTKKNKADKDKTKKNKNKKGESEETEKTKREKRKEKKMVFKPIPRDNPLFDEVKKLKGEIKLKFHLLEEKSKNLLKEIMKFGVMVGTTIPAAIVLSAPPSFNIPGAVTLVLNLMNAFSSISSKIQDLLPYLDVVNKLNAVIPSDKMGKVSSSLNGFLGIINQITSLFSKFKSLMPKLSETDEGKLKDLQTDVDNLDKKINSLRVEDFDSQSDYEKEKKRLEKEKEKKSKKVADMLSKA